MYVYERTKNWYLVKKLVKLSELEQVSIPIGQGDRTSVEEREDPVLQLVDDVLAEVPVGVAVSRKRGGLLPGRLSRHGEEILVGVVQRPADLKHRHELAVAVVPEGEQ